MHLRQKRNTVCTLFMKTEAGHYKPKRQNNLYNCSIKGALIIFTILCFAFNFYIFFKATNDHWEAHASSLLHNSDIKATLNTQTYKIKIQEPKKEEAPKDKIEKLPIKKEKPSAKRDRHQNGAIRKKRKQEDQYMVTIGRIVGDNNDKGCGHTLDRDYAKNPVRVRGLFRGEWLECAIRCVSSPNEIADVSKHIFGTDYCPHSLSFTFTMENIKVKDLKHDDNTLVGTTKLDSDVPVPYFSWAEYDFMKPPNPKTANAMMAAFISNCNARKRLQILGELMSYGVTVHSFGNCMKNAAIPRNIHGSYLDVKTGVTSTYKFTFAAENSETDDYVTEKLFGTLSAGSVPVYIGAPNVHKFVPSPKSVINVADFKSTKELADFLIELDKNDTKYQEYLAWKKEGPSKSFIAVVDRAIVHSSCRLCIKTADYHRAMYGNRVGHEKKREVNPGDLALQVRPRGEFYLRYIYLDPSEQNLESLYIKVVELYKDQDPEVGEVFSIYRLWDRLERPLEDEDFKNGVLEEDMELEIIFTYPAHPERHGYFRWQQKNGKA